MNIFFKNKVKLSETVGLQQYKHSERFWWLEKQIGTHKKQAGRTGRGGGTRMDVSGDKDPLGAGKQASGKSKSRPRPSRRPQVRELDAGQDTQEVGDQRDLGRSQTEEPLSQLRKKLDVRTNGQHRGRDRCCIVSSMGRRNRSIWSFIILGHLKLLKEAQCRIRQPSGRSCPSEWSLAESRRPGGQSSPWVDFRKKAELCVVL